MIYYKFMLTLTLIYLFSVLCSGITQTRVSVYQEFTISLKSNPSTGFYWKCVNAENLKNQGYLDLLNLKADGSSNDYIADVSGRIGGGGTTYFKFRALKRGRITLNFIYSRYRDSVGKSTRNEVIIIR